MVRSLSICILIVLSAFDASARTIAFVNVNVIPMGRSGTLQNQTVIVRDGVIDSIGNAATVRIPRDATSIDCSGKFLIPGLVDMHVHLTLATRQALPVLVANGVTTVRDMGGDLKTIDEWRRQIDADQLIGPRIFRSGPYVDGPKDAPDRLVIQTRQEAENAVSRLKALKVDFIKIHNAVPRSAYFGLLQNASRSGIKVVGHIPLGVKPAEAVTSGQSGFEHMTSLIEDRVATAAKDGKTPLQALAEFDDAVAGALFQKMAKKGVWMTPNLVAERAITLRAEIELAPDERVKYVAASLRKYWSEVFTAKPTAARKLLLNRYMELVKSMRLHGVRMLTGTDLGLRDIYPGFSLHDDLELLVLAGLSPIEALRTATLNPARFFGASADLGTIKKKGRADMILLSADPTIDIKNVRSIEAVVLGGRLFNKTDLERMLTEAAAAAENN